MNKLEIQRCSHKLVGSKGYTTLCLPVNLTDCSVASRVVVMVQW